MEQQAIITGSLKESPLFWPAHIKKGVLYVLDETLIPKKKKYIPVHNVHEAVRVIRQMKTRAFGQFLVVLSTFLIELERHRGVDDEKLLGRIEKAADLLNNSRPTFPFAEVTSQVVLWARQALKKGEPVSIVLNKSVNGYLMGIRMRRMERVKKIADLIEDGDSVLTHCNVSGELAMAAHLCKQASKRVVYYATETRPYFQGAKLTVWELKAMGVPVTLIADNAIAKLMADGAVSKVIVGSDRSCANGDVANKIGTYQIAVVAKEFNIPFYVLTQPSQKIKQGKDIPIEMRDELELLRFRRKRIAPAGVHGFYPGFDVVPHQLITGSVAINVH